MFRTEQARLDTHSPCIFMKIMGLHKQKSQIFIQVFGERLSK
ncbi:protein of unknown function [Methylorubrum extorquens]|uniref:Transposase n=1 Tax=Methylorubrum extorquens TaxID=408 RepID=A0A2N9AWS7_METEX|nr:protein of unknown function [Methylorubrum extorquens]